MRKFFFVCFLLLILFISVACTAEEKGKTFSATIVQVVDGDTVKIKQDGKLVTIRILNIDTPETYREKQAYGEEAKQFAKKVLLNQKVTIELSAKENPYDRYGRLLAYIWVDEDTLYEEMVLQEGLARVAYLFEPDTKYAKRLYEAEEKARKAKRGVWSVDGYVTEEGFDMSVWLENAS
jgi:micrococcal nuclease